MRAGNAFRSAFGASPNGVTKAVLPVAIAACCSSLSAGPASAHSFTSQASQWPEWSRCSYLARQAPFIASLGIPYCCSWLVFYYQYAWKTVTTAGNGPASRGSAAPSRHGSGPTTPGR
ncbi:MAG: hypothetical protein ACT4P7_10565 [Gemmatimonadaceae bacterium]